MADFTFIDFFPDFARREFVEGQQGWNDIFGDPLLNPAAGVGIKHLVFTVVLVALLGVMALIARRKYRSRKTALVPDGKLTMASFFEAMFDGIIGMMTELMGEKAAKRYFPLIAALACFIFFGNVIGLVPGFYHPTSNLNTGLACAIVVFLVYNAAGFMDQGLGYIKHFMGPVLLIAPLMLIIELASHAFRPISLSVRLGGNMTGDHLVLQIFGDLASEMIGVPFLLPIPFMFMGLLVCIIQALVFCLLSSVYIALSLHHEDH